MGCRNGEDCGIVHDLYSVVLAAFSSSHHDLDWIYTVEENESYIFNLARAFMTSLDKHHEYR